MAARPALPDRYLVDRVGTPDPESSRYYVIDVMHDLDARVALRQLINKYRHRGPSVRADELETLLDETDKPFGELIQARSNQSVAKRGKARVTS